MRDRGEPGSPGPQRAGIVGVQWFDTGDRWFPAARKGPKPFGLGPCPPRAAVDNDGKGAYLRPSLAASTEAGLQPYQHVVEDSDRLGFDPNQLLWPPLSVPLSAGYLSALPEK